MKFFVTGTTSGLGNSIQKKLEELSNKLVVLNRSKFDSNTINQLIINDLRDIENLEHVLLNYSSVLEDVDVCIMNAGTLGTINNCIDISTADLIDSFYINCLANKVIVDFFLKNSNCKKFVYISSGAASKPYTGWLEYCSSKSYSDAMFRVYAKENPEKIFISVSPGAIATKMQNQIRNSSVEKYPDMQKFIDLFGNNMLRSPGDAANAIIQKIDQVTIDDSGSFIKI
jgi:benzil reductase ((S)-benzoin forming)